MAQAMTWNDVLARTDLVGGFIESHEEGDRFYGPISEIIKDGKTICIKSPWYARLNTDTGDWEKWGAAEVVSVVEDFAQPVSDGDGSVLFSMQLLGNYALFPNDLSTSRLDSNEIKGLPKDYERAPRPVPGFARVRSAKGYDSGSSLGRGNVSCTL